MKIPHHFYHLLQPDNPVSARISEKKKTPVTAVSFLPCSTDFSCVCALWCGSSIVLWELNEKKELKNFPTTNTGHFLRFSPCGRWLVSVEDSKVSVCPSPQLSTRPPIRNLFKIGKVLLFPRFTPT